VRANDTALTSKTEGVLGGNDSPTATVTVNEGSIQVSIIKARSKAIYSAIDTIEQRTRCENIGRRRFLEGGA
jgi:hypothetical protein